MIKIITNIRSLFTPALVSASLAVGIFSCSKAKLEPVETYPPSPKALVKFLDGAPNPAIGTEGSLVTFKISGLKGKDTSQFKFFINQTLAQVISIDSASVLVKVPVNASTGGSSVLINGEYYFGPTFKVKGKVTITPEFNPDANAANGAIFGIFKNADNNYLIYGSFIDYGSNASLTNTITGLAEIGVQGGYRATVNVGKFGINGSVNSVLQLPSSNYMIAGSFSKYDTVSNVNNITQIAKNGTLQTMIMDVVNLDPVKTPNGDKDTVPNFNGGISGGGIVKTFYSSSTGAITVVGNFNTYLSTFYERSTHGGPNLDRIQIRQLVRMNANGSFDSTYNYNRSTGKGNDVGNGNIFDAIQLTDERIIVVGNFSSFNGAQVNYITRINTADGSVDQTFNAGGSGADGNISRITYNSTTNKILLTGSFKNYNGQPANGVVMINPNGSIDPTFKFRTLESGIPNYAGQLNNGKIIVSGSFNKYDNIVRPGLLILNADGSLASGYNNSGLFRGMITGFVEMADANTNIPQVILVGFFDRFDGRQVGNIVKFNIEN